MTTLDAVTVSGAQPGPGLWRVSKGDHVMWVLGTLSPLPAHMEWKSDEVERAIANSQIVLGQPTFSIRPNTNFFGRLFLIPSLAGANKNPDGRTLQQMVSTEDYARWTVLKQQYLGDDHDVERLRPIFATGELYAAAIKHQGLTASLGVDDVVRALAKKHNVKVIATDYVVAIDEPRRAVKAFKSSTLDDGQCFGLTLDLVEHDLGGVVELANAWATGDINELRNLTMDDLREACMSAVTNAGVAKQLGLDSLKAKVAAMWLAAAEQALSDHAQSFAMLPMVEVLSPTGFIAQLKAKDYHVEGPEGSDAEVTTSQP
ncbi:TraB/GumN family protein [Dyella japonica]|uniref:TraB/GumN family protein n=1 Tax=Dyella japonica TaxID=231455 RepID=UPI001FCD0574|nr:TraB/GumN family protein [Dyella japonica]